MTNKIEIIAKLRMAQSSSCSCLTKTPEVSWHEATCLYRVLSEAIDVIAAPALHPLQQCLHANGELIAAQATIAQQAQMIEHLKSAQHQCEPVKFIYPDVSTWPEWANWTGLDPSGYWVFYENKPEITQCGRLPKGGVWGQPRLAEPQHGWAEMLYQRPAKCSEVLRIDAEVPAARDIIVERQRQIAAEGHKPDRDDCYNFGELALAAAGYAASAGGARVIGRKLFRWDECHWKPSTPRRDLVKAGALILAEIERIDRAALAAKPQ